MEDREIKILDLNSELIVKDLHGDVFDDLHKEGVLNLEEYNIIHSLNLQEEKNTKFLKILRCKRNGLQPFMNALKIWYWWIEEKLREKLEEKWQKAIYLTNIPPIHRRNVSRFALLEEVRTALKKLQKGQYVVLYGMSGCGKSSLAAEALHHDILVDQFQGQVYWLSCSQDSSTMRNKEESKVDENEILALQVQLNDKICNEELVSNVGAANVKKLNVQLRKRFQESDFKEGLIVLDDVQSAQVVEGLNIGCRTLVITNSQDVMKHQGNRYTPIKVNEGFTEEETLNYLALCVDLPVDKLPTQAWQIHLHGKGHPLIISLIGAQLEAHQEEAKNNFASWNPYLEVLISKKYGNLKRWSEDGTDPITRTIELCFNSLTCEMREKYKDFALFVEDVNIDIQVLEILWNLRSLDVKNIMNEFLNKSLIVRKYNTAKNCYVYGVHDLLLYYLKTEVLTCEERMNLHRKLIQRYKEVCNGDVALLPKDDNYFFYYIGHHIAQAKLFTLFPEWYFNLDFIDAKLKVAGPGDLLLDYKRYSPHFADNCFDPAKILRKLSDFVKFVESAGMDVRRNNGPDIVQLALQEPQDSEVYKAAIKLAHSRTNSIYLHFPLGPSISRSGPYLIQAKEKVSSACFLKDTNLIVGYESGLIQIINLKADNRVIRLYEGHSSVVSRLEVSEASNVFLSVSGKDVNIWKLPDLDSAGYFESGERTPSPSQRQTDFTYLFDHATLERKTSWLSFEHKSIVDWATFSKSGSKIASCSSIDKKVEVSDVSSKSMYIRTHALAKCCLFSQNEELLIIGCYNSYILIHNIVNNSAVNHIVGSYPILELFSLPANDGEMKFGALTKATLCVWEMEVVVPSKQSVEHKKTNNVPCLRDYNRGEAEFYKCCVAAPDGSAVAVATTGGKILICELNGGTVIREVGDSNCNIKYVAMDKTKEHKLMACVNDTAIKIWTLGELQSGRYSSMKKNFDVAWIDYLTPVVVAPTYKNCVKKVTGRSQIEEELLIPVICEVNVCAISKCSRVITASTSDREVYLYVDGNDSKMVKICTVEENISSLKVETCDNKICISIGCDRSLTIWMCEEDILKTDTALSFKKSFQGKLANYYLFLESEEFITVSQRGSVKKWHLGGKGELLGELCKSRLDVLICDTDLSCNNDLVTLDKERMLCNIYYLGTEGDEHKITLSSSPLCCSFSIDGKKLVIGFQNGIEVWDMSSLKLCFKEPIALETPIKSVCVSRRGLVGAATNRRVVMRSLEGKVGQAKLQVDRVLMSPDDSTVITVDSDGHMHLIEIFSKTTDKLQLSMSHWVQ